MNLCDPTGALTVSTDAKLVFNLDREGCLEATDNSSQLLHFVCKEPDSPTYSTNWNPFVISSNATDESATNGPVDYFYYATRIPFTDAVEICQERHNGTLLNYDMNMDIVRKLNASNAWRQERILT